MVVSNNLKRGVHPQRAELMNMLPVATTALSCMTTAEDGDSRDIFYLVGSTFWKYDKLAQTTVQLATPQVAPVTVCDMRYTMRRGHHGTILGATSTSVRIGGRVGKLFNGQTLRTLTNTGAGQERVLTWTKDNVHEFGVCSGGSGTANMQDNTKKWKINQWAGYTVGITFGQDQTEYKTILYNDTNTLYVSDVNLQPHNPWNNQPYVANAPYAVVSAAAAVQSHYEICSQDFTVPAWTVTPDTTTTFTTLTGGIWLVSALAAAPFFSTQYYDVIADRWQSKTVQQGLLDVALGTNVNIERTGKIGTASVTGTFTSATARTATDSALALTPDRYNNYRILITGGTGVGQNRRITCHTATQFWIPRDWDITPDATSTYEIWADFDRIYMAIGGRSTILAYSPENDYWMQGQSIDDGICAILSVKKGFDVPFGISTGTRIAAGITAIASAPTAGGTGYSVGDVLTCAVGGAGAQVIVTSIAVGGIVTGLELFSAGTTTGYVVGTGRATTGGTGTACTINITAVGPTVRVTMATSHTYKTGDTVVIAGNTDALHNGSTTILCVPGLTTFDVATTATGNMATTLAQSTTVIADPTKNWQNNELVGKILDLNVAGTGPTTQKRWILSNTANTITVNTITAGVSGTSKYSIYEAETFGAEYQYKIPEKANDGHASGGSTTTLVDSSKNWNVNQWAGYKMHIKAGTGFATGIITIISNTETTLTYAVQGFTPNTTTCYKIHDTWGLCTAATASSLTETGFKNWGVNYFGGKRCKIIAGTGTTGVETIIQTNTATVLTVATNGLTAGDTTTVYAIHGTQLRSSGAGLIWFWGSTNDTGRYMLISRGGASNTADILDLTTGKIAYGLFFSPQQETFTTGTQYAYDGADTLYVQKDATGRIFEFDFMTMTMKGAMQISDLTANITGTAVQGNRMEIIDIQGLNYLVMAQPTGQKIWRILIIPN